MVKFLIIRFSSIGDIVLTTPVLRNLKQQVDGAEIHFLTKKQFTTVVEANPYIDQVWALDRNMPQLLEKLKYEHFDYIIDLHNNLRSRKVKQSLGMLAFSFKKLNWEKWLMTNFKINKLPDVHIVDRYMETLSVFDVKNDEKGLDYFIPAGEKVSMDDLPVEYRKAYVAFVIGAQHATKKLPPEKIAEICAKLELPVILLGGPEDKETAEEIVAKSQAYSSRKNIPVFNSCGKFSINQSASLVKQANVVISHDTGLMHIAAAFKKKIISVWGNTIPEFGMYPYFPDESSKIFQFENLKCRPCTKIGFSKCPKKHFDCMNKQDVEGIVKLARELFKNLPLT